MSLRVKFQALHTGQREIYDNMGQRNIIRAGRRFGKSFLLEARYSKRALQGRWIGWFTPTYKLMRPTYMRIRNLLSEVVSSSSKTESKIELITGGFIEFWSLEDEDAGRSRSYDDVIIDEAGVRVKGLRERVEQAIKPTLLDRRGTLTLAGTPKGVDPDNYFYQAATDKTLGYKEFHAPTSANPTLDPQGVADLQKENSPLVYQQEYLAEFVDWAGDAFFSKEKLLYDNQPVQWPAICNTVFAVIDSATKTGKDNDGTAVMYFAYNQQAIPGTCPLVILDWDISQIEGAMLELWLPNVFKRLDELALACRARGGASGVWIEDKASGMILLQQARNKKLKVHPIPNELTALGKSERAIDVSSYVWRDLVKFSQFAFDKVTNYKGSTRNHAWSQIVGFRVGIKDQVDDDALDAFTYGIALSLGNNKGF